MTGGKTTEVEEQTTSGLLISDENQTELASVIFQNNLKKVLEDDPKQTLFQKQSISERLDQLRNLGFKQD